MITIFNISMIFLLLSGLCLNAYNIKLNKTWITIHSLSVAAFLASFKNITYGDSIAYYNHYMYDYNVISFEPLYSFIVDCFRFFYPTTPIYLFFFIAFSTVFILDLAIKRIVGFKKGIFISIIFGMTFSFYYLLFETIRDGLGFSLLILSISFLVEDKKGSESKFYIILLCAILCHYSYIMFALLPIMLRIKPVKLMPIFLMLAAMSSIVLFPLAKLLISDGIILQKLLYYEIYTNASNTLLLRSFLFIMILPLVLKYSPSKNYAYVYCYYCMLLLTFLPFDEVLRRLLFKGPILILIPICMFLFRDKNKGYLICFFVMASLYFNLFLIYYRAMYGLLDYTPVW
ncbi:EpsG family protein [Vibrio atlanticus]|uniref:EpsG family protein n=1 Tax=Vibrio atlanticus TaxID=693153 RepID=UPI001428C5F1|nr:EpsG family protein [Vibrio atlanticus]